MQPHYKINLGNAPLTRDSSGAQSILTDLQVQAGVYEVNNASIKMSIQDNVSVAAGDDVSIEIGVRDTELVFSGKVREVKTGFREMEVYAESSLSNLAKIRTNKLYEQQKAGDIVRDFAGQGDLETGLIQFGLEYPAYAADEGKSLFQHLIKLAQWDGLDAYADHQDRLVFARFLGGTVHLLNYGGEIIDFKAKNHTVPVDGVEVFGESPASLGQGKEAHTWLTKKEVKGAAGSSDGNVFRVFDPALRDLSSVTLVAQNLYQQMSKTKTGDLQILGRPGVRLGDTIMLNGLPASEFNGAYRVWKIKHRLNKKTGFTTQIHWKTI